MRRRCGLLSNYFDHLLFSRLTLYRTCHITMFCRFATVTFDHASSLAQPWFKTHLRHDSFPCRLPVSLMTVFRRPNRIGAYRTRTITVIIITTIIITVIAYLFIFDKFPPHGKCTVTRSLQITSCSSRRDHSVGGDGTANRGCVRLIFGKTSLASSFIYLFIYLFISLVK